MFTSPELVGCSCLYDHAYVLVGGERFADRSGKLPIGLAQVITAAQTPVTAGWLPPVDSGLVVVNDVDRQHLRRCVELARAALDAGHGPFGAVLVSARGRTLYEDHNRVTDRDQTLHAELGVIGWATANVAPVQRVRATLYTSCEHCPMCAAAHAWAGLGRVVYATSNHQLTTWLTEWRAPAPPVAMLPFRTVAPRVVVDGPAPELEEEMKALYEARYRR